MNDIVGDDIIPFEDNNEITLNDLLIIKSCLNSTSSKNHMKIFQKKF